MFENESQSRTKGGAMGGTKSLFARVTIEIERKLQSSRKDRREKDKVERERES